MAEVHSTWASAPVANIASSGRESNAAARRPRRRRWATRRRTAAGRTEEGSELSEKGRRRRVSERRPAGAQGPGDGNMRTDNLKRPAQSFKRPATGDRRPATGDRRPATGDRRPAIVPLLSEDPAAAVNRRGEVEEPRVVPKPVLRPDTMEASAALAPCNHPVIAPHRPPPGAIPARTTGRHLPGIACKKNADSTTKPRA